ncbi:MAG: isochorismate synthase [Marinifilaceae bacterium]
MNLEPDRSQNLFWGLTTCIQNNIPFYIYRFPESHEIVFGIQKRSEVTQLENLNELPENSGFLMAPFDVDSNHPTYFLRSDFEIRKGKFTADQVKWLENCHFKLDEVAHGPVESSRNDYFVQINRLLEELKGGAIRKAILSRIDTQEEFSLQDAPEIFLAMAEKYSHAFLFMVHIPGKVSWLGASPETLLQKRNGQLFTMALAGTQAINGHTVSDAVWGRKDIEEQAFVSEYIEERFQKFGLEQIHRNGPFTSRAGNLFHLKTDYLINDKLSCDKLSGFIRSLHPTPAVCGLPRKDAFRMIQQLELHDREYYAGFLGPIDRNGDFSLFVNLRSMKLMRDKIALYVGGGITCDSIPEEEWKETCLKAETLMQVIRPLKD